MSVYIRLAFIGHKGISVSYLLGFRKEYVGLGFDSVMSDEDYSCWYWCIRLSVNLGSYNLIWVSGISDNSMHYS